LKGFGSLNRIHCEKLISIKEVHMRKYKVLLPVLTILAVCLCLGGLLNSLAQSAFAYEPGNLSMRANRFGTGGSAATADGSGLIGENSAATAEGSGVVEWFVEADDNQGSGVEVNSGEELGVNSSGYYSDQGLSSCPRCLYYPGYANCPGCPNYPNCPGNQDCPNYPNCPGNPDCSNYPNCPGNPDCPATSSCLPSYNYYNSSNGSNGYHGSDSTHGSGHGGNRR
jgi:hypothetical protein